MMVANKKEKSFSFVKPISIKEFSSTTGISSVEIIKYFFLKGTVVTLNSGLKKEDCETICTHFKCQFQVAEIKEENPFAKYCDLSQEKDLVACPPVVTIMGHVDHGKTTLLDKIRKSNVADREFAKITQHIGAYQIIYKGNPITFLDTPGHAAFTKMRRMGGQVANIVVLVVTADDGLQPQTIEAIQHALASSVKLIVFVNKIDRGTSELPNIKKELSKHNVLLEEFGGDVMLITGSALKGDGIDSLLESIVLTAELEGYQTTHTNPAIGVVIEANIEKGIGHTATAITSRGIIKIGDFLVMASSLCKIRNLIDENKKNLQELKPGTPAKISGFKELPQVGDRFISFKSETEAKAYFAEIGKKKETKIFDIDTEKSDSINLIIKTDVTGTLEAIKHLIEKEDIKIIGYGVGSVSDADVQLASISSSVIINFNQKLLPNIEDFATRSHVAIKNYKSIYQLQEDLESLKNKEEFIEKVEFILGSAKVVKLWHHSKVGTIAGCIMQSGKISLKNKVKVLRGEDALTTTVIKTFKTENFEIKEAKEGNECGIVLQNWNDIKVGDLIQAFELRDKV